MEQSGASANSCLQDGEGEALGWGPAEPSPEKHDLPPEYESLDDRESVAWDPADPGCTGLSLSQLSPTCWAFTCLLSSP